MARFEFHSSARSYAKWMMLVLAGAFLLLGSPGRDPVLAAEAPATPPTSKAVLKTVVIPVEGMACVACAANVKRTIKALDGVSNVEVSLGTRSARVTYVPDKSSPDRIAAAIDQLGYKAGTPQEIQ